MPSANRLSFAWAMKRLTVLRPRLATFPGTMGPWRSNWVAATQLLLGLALAGCGGTTTTTTTTTVKPAGPDAALSPHVVSAQVDAKDTQEIRALVAAYTSDALDGNYKGACALAATPPPDCAGKMQTAMALPAATQLLRQEEQLGRSDTITVMGNIAVMANPQGHLTTVVLRSGHWTINGASGTEFRIGRER